MNTVERLAERLGIGPRDWMPFGPDIAKLLPSARDRARMRDAAPRLVLVSAITPTPAGEGKTTTAIGLAQGLARLGESACVALREPSLGPCLGRKGGGAGGGRTQVLPADRINLHFTGDLHAVGAAHNLLAALLDNHLHFGESPRVDPRRIAWPRVVDLNDRSLRHIVVGLGGPGQGVPRETGFDITAASEVMATLCLSEDAEDLRRRLDRIVVARAEDGAPVTAGDLRATGAMLALLRDALLPNLVATTEGVPALIHGGPFANIAHGCSSLIATRTAMRLADWVVTEAGFGFDLGGEKFFDIKCRRAGLGVAAVVLVVTLRALRLHGGRPLVQVDSPMPAAVERGLENLDQHVEACRCFGQTPLVAINCFPDDSRPELGLVAARCARLGVPCVETDHYARGGEGAESLARLVREHADPTRGPSVLYDLAAPVMEKLETVARRIYGADRVQWSPRALGELHEIEQAGHAGLPICVAKTPSSLSDDPHRLGRPRGFAITVERLLLNAGAGFLVVLTGDIVRMPGLPRRPRAEGLDLKDGEIVGLE